MGCGKARFGRKGPESQNPRQRVSNADQKVLANLESSLLAEEFPDTLQYKITK